MKYYTSDSNLGCPDYCQYDAGHNCKMCDRFENTFYYKLELRRKVANYLRGCNVSPLKFNGYDSPKDEFDPSKFSVVDVIIRVLELTRDHTSLIAENGAFQCRADASRSVLDIWRHIRYYYPTISLFEVMRNMHKVKGLGGLFCTTVMRQVFNFYEGFYTDAKTEFDIMFDEWRLL